MMMYRFVIDGEKITTKAAFFDSAAAQLPLPSWCGRNLDALHDAVTCDILPKDSIEIVIHSPAALREHLGNYAEAVISMLSDIASEDTRLTVTVSE